MTPEQFKRVSEVFLLARKCTADELAALLDRECGSDCLVREEVERMLRFDSDDSIDSAQIQLGHHPAGNMPEYEPYPPGAQIGEYTVTRTLGEGGMGRVIEVQQAHPRRRVALKLLRQESLSRAMLQRFDHEIRILGEMQHEGIARIHAAGWTDGQPPQPYFTMELIDGEPLTAYATKHRLGTRQRLNLVAIVCDAVQYAHQRGVVHRDLKPANILVSADEKPKVVDFGIARIGDAESAANTLRTATGQIIGTLPYMSPEQVSGDPANVDSRTDVYALGVILYELLSGKLPHDLDKRSIAEAARLVQESGISKLGTIDRALRGDIETIVAKALEKEPDRRYASASELASDIRRYLSNQPIVARPSSAAYQIRKFASRHRSAAMATMAIVLTMIAATAFSASRAVQADRARRKAERQAEIADAINQFLNNDLLASVAPSATGTAGRGKDVRMSEVLAEASHRIDAACEPGGSFADKPEVEASIRGTLGRTLMKLGDIAAAYPHLARSFELRKECLGEGHVDTMAAAVNLGGNLYIQNQTAEASALFERALEAGRESLGADHRLVLECESSYVNVLLRLQRFDEALALLDHVLKVRRETLGPHDNATCAVLVQLAMTYKQLRRYDEAEPIEREVLAHFQESYGRDDPHTLRVANNLGTTLYYQGQYAEAEKQWRSVYEQRRRVLGLDHYETLTSCMNLASALVEQGRPVEAEPIYRAGYDATVARYGEENPKALDFAFGLANAIRDQRRFDEAEPIYQRTIERRVQSIGYERRDTIQVLIGLFDMRMMQDRPQDAERVLAGPVAALKEADKLADNSRCIEPLIACRLDLGMHEEAIDLARAYAASIRAKEGEDSPSAIRVEKLIQQTEERIAKEQASQDASD